MRVLGIFSAYGGASAAILEDGDLLSQGRLTEERGLAASLPALLERVLDKAGRSLDLVAVATGPGSFTGLRAGIAVASGIGLALSVPVSGITVAEALSEGLTRLDGRTLWVAIEARRGRLFLDTGGGPYGTPNDRLPRPPGRIAVAGSAANFVAGALAARGADVMLTSAPGALAEAVARAALRRNRLGHEPRRALPLYVDAPEAKLPAAGLRPPPL
jgi:tRNA threonylcarbamoyl adenosine modification protein YeaZ